MLPHQAPPRDKAAAAANAALFGERAPQRAPLALDERSLA
jgi:hypothetical protein